MSLCTSSSLFLSLSLCPFLCLYWHVLLSTEIPAKCSRTANEIELKNFHWIIFTWSLDVHQFQRKNTHQPPNDAADKVTHINSPPVIFPFLSLSLSVLSLHTGHLCITYCKVSRKVKAGKMAYKQGSWNCSNDFFFARSFLLWLLWAAFPVILQQGCGDCSCLFKVQSGAQPLLQWASSSASFTLTLKVRSAFCHHPGSQKADVTFTQNLPHSVLQVARLSHWCEILVSASALFFTAKAVLVMLKEGESPDGVVHTCFVAEGSWMLQQRWFLFFHDEQERISYFS